MNFAPGFRRFAGKIVECHAGNSTIWKAGLEDGLRKGGRSVCPPTPGRYENRSHNSVGTACSQTHPAPVPRGSQDRWLMRPGWPS